MEWLVVVGSLILLPFFIYYCVKFGTRGYFRGKHLEDNQREQQEVTAPKSKEARNG